MKTLPAIFAALFSRLGAPIAVSGAVLLALNGVSGWGWFLAVGLLLS
ncbi:MAG: hypothetical protein E6093_17370 [Serratia liquefaciens]|nr:hypothetical protein [Serratia liquefaciens]